MKLVPCFWPMSIILTAGRGISVELVPCFWPMSIIMCLFGRCYCSPSGARINAKIRNAHDVLDLRPADQFFTDDLTLERESAHPRATLNPKSPPDARNPALISARLIRLTSLKADAERYSRSRHRQWAEGR